MTTSTLVLLLCLIGSLVLVGLLILQVCDLRLSLRQAKLDGEQRQYWFDQYMDASKQLKQRAAEDLADAARFGDGWKHPTPAAFRAGTAANPVLTPLGHPSRYSELSDFVRRVVP